MKISMLIAMLAAVCIAVALDVTVTNSEGFEIDAFNAGDEIVFDANTGTRPSISIYLDGAKVVDADMLISDDSYIYKFVPEEKGTYNVEVRAGSDVESTKIFVTRGLDLDWDRLIEENKEEAVQEPQAEVRWKGSILQWIIDFIKSVIGIING